MRETCTKKNHRVRGREDRGRGRGKLHQRQVSRRKLLPGLQGSHIRRKFLEGGSIQSEEAEASHIRGEKTEAEPAEASIIQKQKQATSGESSKS